MEDVALSCVLLSVPPIRSGVGTGHTIAGAERVFELPAPVEHPKHPISTSPAAAAITPNAFDNFKVPPRKSLLPKPEKLALAEPDSLHI